jgi:hypothetical protein
MTPADLKDWKAIGVIIAGILSGGSLVVTSVIANEKAARDDVEIIIERHPVIVELKTKVEHLSEKVAENHEETQEQLRKILDAIKENGR